MAAKTIKKFLPKLSTPTLCTIACIYTNSGNWKFAFQSMLLTRASHTLLQNSFLVLFYLSMKIKAHKNDCTNLYEFAVADINWRKVVNPENWSPNFI